MKIYKFLSGIILLLTLTITCEKGNNSSTINYHYEPLSSILKTSATSIFFIDENIGFIANYSGQVFKTIDKGLTWTSSSITDLPLTSIYFINKDIGFVVGGKSSCGGSGCTVPGSIVFKTIDGGVTWVKQTIPYAWSELNSVYFIDENIGFAVGLGLQLRTINGGQKWDEFKFGYKGWMGKVKFVSSSTGFAAGLLGNIFKTSDQGTNWSKTSNESDGHIYDFCFPDLNVGYAAGQKEIVKSTDGGNTWKILTNSPIEIYFIHFTDDQNGIAIGKGHYTGGDWGYWTSAIYRTSDGGVTWAKEDNVKFGSVTSFFSKKIGYSVGNDSIYKITME
jgi:photosystem II stability/assembly factor-like uncharacterized protein